MVIAKKCKSCIKKCKVKVTTPYTTIDYCPDYSPKTKVKGKK